MTVNLSDPIFHDEDAARAKLEAIRWPNGPFCPHCGAVEGITRLQGQSHRPGLHQCNACRGHFTLTNGSVMERSHVPLHKWVLAFHLMAASKKGMSAHQLSRMLDVTYKTAWFMAHRIREAMTDKAPPPLGGEGKVVKADETHGKRETPVERSRNARKVYLKGGKSAQKRPIVGLVEGGGEARAYFVPRVTAKNVRDVLVKNADRKSRLHTDESNLYPEVGKEFSK
ncbi:MAG: IS1595 family transposase, partial [Acetobacteraceae bacterium]|nr:IS1595 family transposase [Acetobacteraceae bacterium]